MSNQHDLAADAVEELDAKTIKQLRIALKRAPGVGQVDVDDLSDAEVVEAADEAGIIDLDELRDNYKGRNPEVHQEGDEQPKGLDTPTSAEISPKDLLLDEVQHNVAREAGVELDGTDLATKAGNIRAEQYAKQRELAEELVDHRQDVDDASRLTDAELRDLTEEEAQKELLGQQGNPNDLDTVVEHMRASHIGTLTTEHGYAREDLNDLTLDQLVGLEAQAREDTTGSADAAGGGVGTDAGGAAESATDFDIDRSVGDGTPADAGDSAAGPPADATPDESNAPSGSGESVPIVYTIQNYNHGGGDFHRSADGRWFDSQGNEVTSPGDLAGLDAGYEDYASLPGAGQTGTVDSISPTGTSHEEAVANQSNEAGDSSDSNDDSGEESGDDSDDNSDDDDDNSDDDDDSDGDGDDTEDAEAVDGEDEDGETSESDGGNTDEGTPNPLGDDPVDPVDQARFDESGFGDEQRQQQVDAIDARSGQAGGPDDDPSDLDTEAFLDTKAGAQAAETIADGVGHRADGGNSDPADLDAVESNGAVIDTKVTGGGLTDPVDDVPTAPPTFGDGGRGNPIVDGPPIVTGPERFGTDDADVGGDSTSFDQVTFETVDAFDGLDTNARIDFDEVDVAAEVELDDVDLVAD